MAGLEPGTLSYRILQDMTTSIEKKKAAINTAAEKVIRESAVPEITAVTPVRKQSYPSDKHPPGYMKSGWTTGSFRVRAKRKTLYGAYNKNTPQLVHLVNFGHRIFVHGQERGVVKGNDFVDRVQDDITEKFHDEVERILDEPYD